MDNPNLASDKQVDSESQNDTYTLGQIAVDPSQASIFDAVVAQTEVIVEAGSRPTHEEVTHMEISHNESSTNVVAEEHSGDDGVGVGTKAKVIAALAIVAVAGYVAYWVQEPVQLKADVLGGNSAPVALVVPGTESSVVATTSEVAMVPTDSKNVDVSLFGFEPAVLKIDKGTTVIWTNTSSEDQTIVGSSKNADSFTSPVLTSGLTFSRKFDKDGVYQYYSTYNPALKATVTVGLGNVGLSESESSVSSIDAAAVLAAEVQAKAEADALVLASYADAEVIIPDDKLEADLSNLTMENSGMTKGIEELKPSADSGKPNKLSKTGPEDLIYLVVLGAIAYFNRKKLKAIFV